MIPFSKKTLRPVVTVAVLFFLLLILAGCGRRVAPPSVIDGTIDLSFWDFEKDGPVRLFGQWRFAWTPPGGQAGDVATGFFRVPGLWKGGEVGARPLGARGNATYTARVLMPEAGPDKMAVLVSGGMSVCEVLINGTKVGSSGRFGTSGATEEPRDHFVTADCPQAGRVMEIELRVSNHHNAQGGLNGDVLLGTAGQVDNFYNTPRLLGACMAGSMLCLALLYVALYATHRSGTEYLYFGLFCLFWCAATLFSPSSGFLMAMLAPSLPWEWYINFSLLPYGAVVPLMLLFYDRLFPKRFGTVVEGVYLALGLAYVIYILATPPNAYDEVPFIYFVASGFALIYLFVCSGMDIYHREKGVMILSVGYLALGLAELDDILFDLHVIDVASLRPFGIFVFILSYASFLAYRFTREHNRAENLAVELEEKNLRLVRLDRMKDEFLANSVREPETGPAGRDGDPPRSEQVRSLAVRVLNLAIDCWVEATGLTKVDLAEQSGLWNVYMERDGYFRTQTLDKYLKTETVPQKPRWKMVFATAEYVLANCGSASPLCRELEEALASLRELASG